MSRFVTVALWLALWMLAGACGSDGGQTDAADGSGDADPDGEEVLPDGLDEAETADETEETDSGPPPLDLELGEVVELTAEADGSFLVDLATPGDDRQFGVILYSAAWVNGTLGYGSGHGRGGGALRTGCDEIGRDAVAAPGSRLLGADPGAGTGGSRGAGADRARPAADADRRRAPFVPARRPVRGRGDDRRRVHRGGRGLRRMDRPHDARLRPARRDDAGRGYGWIRRRRLAAREDLLRRRAGHLDGRRGQRALVADRLRRGRDGLLLPLRPVRLGGAAHGLPLLQRAGDPVRHAAVDAPRTHGTRLLDPGDDRPRAAAPDLLPPQGDAGRRRGR